MQNHFIIGVDEVGRGCLLGDVVVCACILPHDVLTILDEKNTPSHQALTQADDVGLIASHPLSALTDSKKLSEKKREMLFPLIQVYAIDFAIAKIPPAKIDEINILQATLLGMRQAIEQVILVINKKFANATFTVVIDGNQLPKLGDLAIFSQIQNLRAIVKGDGRHVSISSASVLAKVSRDNDMKTLAKIYPNYAIEKHKGYGTVAHLQAIENFGVLAEHRKSFAPIKNLS